MVSLTTNGAISHLFDVRSEQYTRSCLVHHARYSLCTSPTISNPEALGLMLVAEMQQDSSKKSSKLAFNPCSIPKGNRLTTRFFFLDFFFLGFSVGFVLDVADGAGGGIAGGASGAGGAGGRFTGGAVTTKGEGTPTATEGSAIVSNAAANAAATKAAFLRRRSSRSETGGLPNRLPLRVVIFYFGLLFQCVKGKIIYEQNSSRKVLSKNTPFPAMLTCCFSTGKNADRISQCSLVFGRWNFR